MQEQQDWNIWLKTQRERALNVLLAIACALGTIGVAYSAWRFAHAPPGSETNLVPYAIAWTVTLLLFLARRVPEHVRAVGFLAVLWAFAVFALRAGWLAGGGRGFLLALTSVAVILLGPRFGFPSAILSVLTYVGFAAVYGLGWIGLRPLPDPVTLPPMVLEGVGFAMAVGIVVTSQWLSGRAVTAASRANAQAREAGALAAARETSFHNVVQRSSDGVVVVCGDGRVCFANGAASGLLGRAPTDLEGGHAPFDVSVDEPQELRIGAPPDGRVVEVHATDTEWDGRPARLALLRDVTDRSRASAERELLIGELEARNAELERFTYTVSHDLKAPLITIKGFIGFLESAAAAGDAGRLHDDIGRIEHAAGHMQRLLDELLHLSQSGHPAGPPESVGFARIVEEAHDLVRGRLEARGVRLSLAETLPAVHVDRARMVEAVQNLLDNGAKFMGGQGDPCIDVGSRGRDAQGRHVLFVRDNGNGIPPEHLERIFGLFNKLSASTEGTGVGLAVVRRIVESQGGTVGAESPGAGPGRGATFVFTLPAAPEGTR